MRSSLGSLGSSSTLHLLPRLLCFSASRRTPLPVPLHGGQDGPEDRGRKAAPAQQPLKDQLRLNWSLKTNSRLRGREGAARVRSNGGADAAVEAPNPAASGGVRVRASPTLSEACHLGGSTRKGKASCGTISSEDNC